jgi:hypothetical protein
MLVCPCCLGAGTTAASCVDCVGVQATVMCPDGRARCDACAASIASAAGALLRRIYERPTEESVQRFIDIGLGLLQRVAT